MKVKVQEEALQAWGMLRRLVSGELAREIPPALRALGAQPAHRRTQGDPAIVPMVKAARLFAVDHDAFHRTLWQPAYKRVMSTLVDAVSGQFQGGEPWSVPQLHEAVMAHQLKAYQDVVANYVWEPLALPFDSLFIAFHNNEEQHRRMQADYQSVAAVKSGRFLPVYAITAGFLVTPTHAYSLTFAVEEAGDKHNVCFELYPLVEEGVLSILERPVEVVNLLALVDLVRIIDQQGAHRLGRSTLEHRKLVRLGKRYPGTPADYYAVDVPATWSAPDPARGTQAAGRVTPHEHDVRAHDATYILRGTLPLETKTEIYLRKDARRKLFLSPADLDAETQTLLAKRGVAIRDNEWVSVLTVRRKAHTRGQGHYVPALHILDPLLGA